MGLGRVLSGLALCRINSSPPPRSHHKRDRLPAAPYLARQLDGLPRLGLRQEGRLPFRLCMVNHVPRQQSPPGQWPARKQCPCQSRTAAQATPAAWQAIGPMKRCTPRRALPPIPTAVVCTHLLLPSDPVPSTGPCPQAPGWRCGEHRQWLAVRPRTQSPREQVHLRPRTRASVRAGAQARAGGLTLPSVLPAGADRPNPEPLVPCARLGGMQPHRRMLRSRPG